MTTAKKRAADHPLTERQLAFIAHFTGNLSEAARLAGYSTNAGSHRRVASAMMKDPRIASAIKAKQSAAVVECGKTLGKEMAVNAENVLRELARLAFYDPRKFIRANGDPVPIHELDDDTAMALAGFEIVEQFEGRGENRVKTGELKKFKIADKGRNLERLGEYLGMFVRRNLNLPSDWDKRTLQEKEFFVENGYWPEPMDAAQPGT